MEINKYFWPLCIALFILLGLGYAVGHAQDMDQGQHVARETIMMQHEPGDADDQMGHGHGKGMWMFEYEFMGMHMEGLLDGTDSVNSRDISGALPGTPPVKDPTKDYMMSPTEMRMNMHMLMLMYGLSEKFSIMVC